MPSKVCIIGAGPSGLVALKTMLEQTTEEYECILLEAETELGGTFRYRSYENAQLVSSKQLTCFSDFRMGSDYSSDHLDLPEYCAYLERYASRFSLHKHIHLNTKVTNVERTDTGHLVSCTQADGSHSDFLVDKLIICAGLHVTPSMPDIRGIEHVKECIHSSEYKGRHQLQEKNVLVLGCGETAMDIAYEAVQCGNNQVVMSLRGGFLSLPKVLNRFSVFGYTTKAKLPIDGLITNLLETTYVHPWVASSRLRWIVSDHILQRVLWFLTGTSAGCNQYAGELPPDRLGRSYVFLNKSSKAMPYINRPYRNRPKWMSKITEYIDPPEDARSEKIIELAPWVCHVESDGEVKFQRGTAQQKKIRSRIKTMQVRPDIVVYCTGYKQDLPFLSQQYIRPEEAVLRNITSHLDTSVAYIGFVRPGVGAIPPIAEMQSLWLASLWAGDIVLPLSKNNYSLLHTKTARIQYGVDHSAYMSTLANDCGSAPDLGQLYKEYGLKVLFTYCFGASFTTFYRLLGPHRMEKAHAEHIVKGELYEIVRRRGYVGNFFWALVPMVFYFWINLGAWLAEKLYNLLHASSTYALGLLGRIKLGIQKSEHPRRNC